MTTPSALDVSAAAAIAAIHAAIPPAYHRPLVAIVCGSGLSTLADTLTAPAFLPYASIPGFASSTVAGHQGVLAFGLLAGTPVVAMLGRLHPYEGHALPAVCFPIRVLARLGVQALILTNAAGALNPALQVGTLVVLHDHLALPGLAGMNPLLGPAQPPLARFVPLSDAYSPALRRLAFLAANDLGLPDEATAEGTYAWVSGPTYETPAEGRFLRAAGVDVVGMSTVPEVVAARQEGVPHVMAISLVTNPVIIPEGYRSIKEEVKQELAGIAATIPAAATVSHNEVLEVGVEKGPVMRSLVERVVARVAAGELGAAPVV
ncbi:nucleoside phosphorylase domain-containing protein [Schizophyllum amplum]|uniref:Purine nucleoside phosphorylase n=1 Tax=Schizophyllum amplum TaxID=97359 RepID=A0A550CU35_9AGAR|nr:nucleoside phosphorylase domain-containing protein [Auriculariopsis ampla]